MATTAASPLLTAPILPTLLRLALPNMGAMLAGSIAAIAETAYIGRLGVPALAAMAVIFPIIMLQGMLSAGAIGSGVSAAIARAIGAGDRPRADALAVHAFWIAIIAGGTTTLVMLAAAPAIFAALGGHGAALDQALAFAGVAFLGSIGVWLLNVLAAVLRGAGNMGVPSATLLLTAVAQVVVGGTLGLGLGPFPQLGMRGVAAGQLVASTLGALVLYLALARNRAGVQLAVASTPLSRDRFADILRVGGPACLSPLQTIATVLILTRLVAAFGPNVLAGYGIGTRLEFLMVPIAFAIGVASVPLVGTAIGGGDIARARRVAWIGGMVAGALLGLVGLGLAIGPDIWTRMFSQDAAVGHAASLYFRWAGPTYIFYGLGLSLYFSSLGAGQVRGVILAGTLRLAVVAIGGVVLVKTQAPVWTVFALIGLGMIAYGAATALAIRLTDWRPRG